MTEPLVPDHLVDRCLAILRQQPAGLVSDVDGTISEIAPVPAAAKVAEDIRHNLSRLARRLDLVGIVSGRAAPVASTLVGLSELVYVGNHGMERLHREEIWHNPEAAAAMDAITAALEEVAAAFTGPEFDWILIENKGVSASVHYRLAPDAVAAEAQLRPVITAAATRHGLIVTDGRLIFEFRPNLAINKGTAIADLVTGNRLRGLIFLGDDLTDVDGFLALHQLREAGVIDGLAIGVLGPESHPRVRETMDIGIPGVPAVAALLAALARRIDPVPL